MQRKRAHSSRALQSQNIGSYADGSSTNMIKFGQISCMIVETSLQESLEEDLAFILDPTKTHHHRNGGDRIQTNRQSIIRTQIDASRQLALAIGMHLLFPGLRWSEESQLSIAHSEEGKSCWKGCAVQQTSAPKTKNGRMDPTSRTENLFLPSSRLDLFNQIVQPQKCSPHQKQHPVVFPKLVHCSCISP